MLIVEIRRTKRLAVAGGLGSWLSFLYGVGVLLYPVGVALKFSRFGPDWAQWHLSDIGFALFVANFLWSGVRAKNAAVITKWTHPLLARMAWTRVVCLLFALVGACTFELFEGLLRNYLANRVAPEKLTHVPGFDLIDVWCYTAGVAFGVILVLLPLWRLRQRPKDSNRRRDMAQMTIARTGLIW